MSLKKPQKKSQVPDVKNSTSMFKGKGIPRYSSTKPIGISQKLHTKKFM